MKKLTAMFVSALAAVSFAAFAADQNAAGQQAQPDAKAQANAPAQQQQQQQQQPGQNAADPNADQNAQQNSEQKDSAQKDRAPAPNSEEHAHPKKS